jgi:hypothetical protein
MKIRRTISTAVLTAAMAGGVFFSGTGVALAESWHEQVHYVDSRTCWLGGQLLELLSDYETWKCEYDGSAGDYILWVWR